MAETKQFPVSSCGRTESSTQTLQHLDLAGTSEEHNQEEKKKAPSSVSDCTEKKPPAKRDLTDGTNLLAHTVLSFPNGKGEAGVQGPAVGKHPSSGCASDQPGCCCLGGYLQHQAQQQQLESLVVSTLACGVRDRAVKPQKQLL